MWVRINSGEEGSKKKLPNTKGVPNPSTPVFCDPRREKSFYLRKHYVFRKRVNTQGGRRGN